MNNQKDLLSWYMLNKRDLPWRNTQDPYLIWLSEIILQQTRVAQGLPYFEKFVEKFPHVELLANAPQDEVLKLWQGLGYYSRARNMHKTAQKIVNDFEGIFPDNYKNLLKLTGIGPYTAAAIASFAYDEPVAVLDGNVFRVLARFFNLSEPIQTNEAKKIFTQLANHFLNITQPALHNQAMMELGALVCTPYNPNCSACPLQNNCQSLHIGNQASLPVKTKKVVVKNRYLAYFHFDCLGELAIFKRSDKGIWQDLYDLPYLESDKKLQKSDWLLNASELNWVKSDESIVLLFEKKHVLTHLNIYAQFFYVKKVIKPVLNLQESWLPKNKVAKLGVSRLLELYFEKFNLKSKSIL
jgi:A/G-specific adenine glycosylase